MSLVSRLYDRLRPGPPPRLDTAGRQAISGRCNICGRRTQFVHTDPRFHRESWTCVLCLATSRYRSLARGLLDALERLAGVRAASLAELPRGRPRTRIAVYDTQVSFDTGASAYPIPTLLERCPWIDLEVSTWKPARLPGEPLGPRTTNQNLEHLTFPDASFDLVLTSDVMEHVRLEASAHREIRRVLKPTGIYIFTVPNIRDRPTLERVRIVDPADPSLDIDVLPREYHGDANSEEGRALVYRLFGTDLDEKLHRLGFEVELTTRDFPESGILRTELFMCRVARPPTG